MPVVSKPDIRNCDGIDLLHSLPDNSIDLFLTDPPYMISKDSGMNKLHERKKAGEELTKTEKKFAKPTNFGKWDEDFTLEILEEFIELYYKKLKPGGTCIVWFDWEKITPLVQMMKKNKFKQSRWFVWIKTNPQPLNSKINYLSNAKEIAVSFVKKNKAIYNSSYNKGVYFYPIAAGKDRFHPTQKSLPLFEEPIKEHTNEGDLVVDTFLGSGTTAVAAKRTGRRFIGSEKDSDYFKKIEHRVASCPAPEDVVSKPEEFEVSPTYSVGEYIQVRLEDGDCLAKILATRDGQVEVEWWYFKDTMPVVSDRVKTDDLVLDNDHPPHWIDVECIQGLEDVSAYKKRFMVTRDRNDNKRKYDVIDKIPNAYEAFMV